MIYNYKTIITAVLNRGLTPDNIKETEFAESFVCKYDMKLRDLFALWDESAINNNTLEEFDNQLKQSRTTIEHGTAYDNENYNKRENESIAENIVRRKQGYRRWILDHLDTDVTVLSITTSETGIVNIAFDKKNFNTPIYSRCSPWMQSYRTKMGNGRVFEYPKVLEVLDEDPKKAIKMSHHFSCVDTDKE